jgi:hypothetical protein
MSRSQMSYKCKVCKQIKPLSDFLCLDKAKCRDCKLGKKEKIKEHKYIEITETW